MEAYKEYFPTKSYRIAEMRLSSLLRVERDRLDGIAAALGREYAIAPDNLREQLPQILQFTQSYHEAYDQYLKAVLVQQPRPIQCRPACGNCCHHYPMSVEPFELIFLYNELRKRDDLLTLMEACQLRSDKFESFFDARRETGLSEDDAEDRALHDYFSWWRPCPFSNESGDCTVYPLRTVSCRMYFSETSAILHAGYASDRKER